MGLLHPVLPCPHHVKGVLGDGGKWVCGMEPIAKQEKCVIYSFGINGGSSFEAALLERAQGCEVWGYNFTMDSFGPGIENDTEPEGTCAFLLVSARRS
ncbi:hypothetical protein EDB86DRAFT_616522 [Lactarius hatsudake]|nr:hypothetical protein EDB86DRAFT_616522 [Lactarius hatsudake]